MDEKKNFLIKASELFLEHGAKTLTMDDISREFGISKKTLYTLFKNKEELIEEVLHYKLQEIIKRLKDLDAKVENSVERMFCRDREIDRVADSNNTVLIKQLIKYYPTIFLAHMKDFASKFSEVMIHNIEKGREQGYYRTDFDAEVYAKLFFQLIMSLEGSLYIDLASTQKEHYRQETMMMYMHAITTEKGKEILKKINY